MAVTTTVAPRQSWKLGICFIVCVAFGIWGWYDFAISIPRREADAIRFQALVTEKSEIEKEAGSRPLSETRIARFEEVKRDLATFGGDVPEPPSKWDRSVQLWLYVIGCGVIGAPYCAFALWQLARRRYTLGDDGSFEHPGGRWSGEEIVDVDMSKWMGKSLATVKHRDGRSVVLDDYKYRNMHLIVGHFANRFHPDEWTAEARIIRKETAEASS